MDVGLRGAGGLDADRSLTNAAVGIMVKFAGRTIPTASRDTNHIAVDEDVTEHIMVEVMPTTFGDAGGRNLRVDVIPDVIVEIDVDACFNGENGFRMTTGRGGWLARE